MKKLLFTLAFVLPTLYFAQDIQKDKKCDLPSNYQEPIPDKKIQSFLKKLMQLFLTLENTCDR
ncbi:hypothetical protein OWR28_17395 [Chryseobacterium sp. 1B4]